MFFINTKKKVKKPYYSLQFLISAELMVVIIIAIVIFSPFRNNSFSVKDCPPDCGTIAGPLLLPGFHLEGPKCRMLDLQIPIPDILLWYQSSEPQNTFLQRPTCCEKNLSACEDSHRGVPSILIEIWRWCHGGTSPKSQCCNCECYWLEQTCFVFLTN